MKDKVFNFGEGLLGVVGATFSIAMLVMGGLSTFVLVLVIALLIASLMMAIPRLIDGGKWLYSKAQELGEDSPQPITATNGPVTVTIDQKKQTKKAA